MYCSEAVGRTKSAEAGQDTQVVSMFYTEPMKQLGVFGTAPELNFTQVLAVDIRDADARFVVYNNNNTI